MLEQKGRAECGVCWGDSGHSGTDLEGTKTFSFVFTLELREQKKTDIIGLTGWL
jgi:hypothetical protein